MHRNKRAGALAAVVVLGLFAAACGSDKKESGATTTAAGGATTTAGGGGATTTAASGSTTTAASSELLKYDESAKCGTPEYAGNLAKLEAVDAKTVKMTLCKADPAIPSKVAFSALQIMPSEYLDSTSGKGDFIDKPIGTGPYKLKQWDRGSQIILEANPDYWGDAPKAKTLVIKWSTESAQRLVELQSGTADGIDNVGTADFDTVKGDSKLQLLDRPATNIFYVGFNRDIKPFDNELVRQAVGYAIDKQRIVDNFYPKGSTAATQFLPETIPGYTKGFQDFTYDPAKAKDLLTQAGFPNGFEVKLSYRDVVRGYLPQPTVVATDIQAQLAQVGIKVSLDQQESGTFLDNANAGKLPFYLLGWGADFPDATNFYDQHFGKGASPQFGAGFTDIQDQLSKAASLSDQTARNAIYADVAKLVATHAPMIPIANGGSATAYQAKVENPQASPLTSERFAVTGVPGQDQFTFIQGAEPSGLWCADETDGEALRVCEQIGESLLAFKINGTDVEPSLATSYEANADLTEWTFHLRDGVKFQDGSTFDANDVVRTYRAQWDAKDPAHTGRTGEFTYFSALFGGFLNPPPAKS